MKDDYKVIAEFVCYGKPMVTIMIGNAAHVMSQDEWHKVYGREHQDRWKTKVDWNRFKPREKYSHNKVS